MQKFKTCYFKASSIDLLVFVLSVQTREGANQNVPLFLSIDNYNILEINQNCVGKNPKC